MTKEGISEERLKKEQHIYECQDYRLKSAKYMGNGASLIFSIMKSMGLQKGGSLTSVLCPAPLLKHISLLEMYSHTSSPKASILQNLESLSAEGRFLAVCKWYLSNAKYYPQSGVQDLKPFNPILGEQMHCRYEHEYGETTFVAEQVSHHPPITSVYMENKKAGWTFEQTHQPKSHFWYNSVTSKIEGNNTFTMVRLGEVYSITLPEIVVRSLIFGTSYLAQEGDLKIRCPKTGYIFLLTFDKSKKYNVSGYVAKRIEGNKARKIFTLSGSLESKLYIQKKDGKKAVWIDFEKLTNVKRVIKPVLDQAENESQRVWHGVRYALEKLDYEDALSHKTTVEERERAKRKQRKKDGENWKPNLFETVNAEMVGSNTPLYRYKNRWTLQSESVAQEDDGMD